MSRTTAPWREAPARTAGAVPPLLPSASSPPPFGRRTGKGRPASMLSNRSRQCGATSSGLTRQAEYISNTYGALLAKSGDSRYACSIRPVTTLALYSARHFRRGEYAVMHESGISIVAPAFEEAENLPELVRKVENAFLAFDAWELIVVDDCSADNSAEVLAALQDECATLRVVRHTSRRGQSAAICTGADAAHYAWLGFLDADGQNDPADLARLYSEMLKAGDGAPGMIMGKRRKRRDSWLTRVSSRIANTVRAALLRDRTPDTGCSLKVLARKDFQALPRFDHMHRFSARTAAAPGPANTFPPRGALSTPGRTFKIRPGGPALGGHRRPAGRLVAQPAAFPPRGIRGETTK